MWLMNNGAVNMPSTDRFVMPECDTVCVRAHEPKTLCAGCLAVLGVVLVVAGLYFALRHPGVAVWGWRFTALLGVVTVCLALLSIRQHQRMLVRFSDQLSGHLLAEEARLALAMEIAALGIWDYHADRESVVCNDQAAIMLGYDPAEFSETRAAFVARLHPEDRSRVRAAFREFLAGQRAGYACEFRMRTRAGAYRWFRSVGRIVARDHAGNPLRVVGIYLDISDMIETQQRLSDLSARLLMAQEDAQRKLARELHDEVGQQLTALGLNLRVLQTQAGPALQLRLDDCRMLLEQTVAQIRGHVLDLRPPMLDDMGLVAALEWYARRQEERSDVCIALDLDELPQRLSGEVELTVFRVVQEAINNAIRHATASRIDVSLRLQPQRLELLVRDDGSGFDAHSCKPDEGVGLAAMRERVMLAGGALDISAQAGAGTAISASIPIEWEGALGVVTDAPSHDC